MTDELMNQAEGLAILQALAAPHMPPSPMDRLTDTLKALRYLARLKAPHAIIEEVATLAIKGKS